MTENILKHFPLKSIHNKYGVNWEQKENMKCYKHEGKFTINGLIKEFNIDLSDLVLITIQYTLGDYTRYGLFILDEGLTTYSIPKFSDFYSKKQVEEIRKQDNIVAYIVAINQDGLIEPKHHESSLWNLTRFVDDINTRFIYKPSQNRLFIDGYMYRAWWQDRKDLEDALDKSGYSVMAKRRTLSYKLEEIHKNNLEKVISTAFNKDNATVFTQLLQAKNTLAEQIKEVTTADELQVLCDSLRNIRYLMERYEKHIEYLQNAMNPEISKYHKYNSIKEVRDNIAQMTTKLANIRGVAV